MGSAGELRDSERKRLSGGVLVLSLLVNLLPCLCFGSVATGVGAAVLWLAMEKPPREAMSGRGRTAGLLAGVGAFIGQTWRFSSGTYGERPERSFVLALLGGLFAGFLPAFLAGLVTGFLAEQRETQREAAASAARPAAPAAPPSPPRPAAPLRPVVPTEDTPLPTRAHRGRPAAEEPSPVPLPAKTAPAAPSPAETIASAALFQAAAPPEQAPPAPEAAPAETVLPLAQPPGEPAPLEETPALSPVPDGEPPSAPTEPPQEPLPGEVIVEEPLDLFEGAPGPSQDSFERPGDDTVQVGGIPYALSADIDLFCDRIAAGDAAALRFRTTRYRHIVPRIRQELSRRLEDSPEPAAVLAQAALLCAGCGWRVPPSFVLALSGGTALSGQPEELPPGAAQFAATGRCSRCGSLESLVLFPSRR